MNTNDNTHSPNKKMTLTLGLCSLFIWPSLCFAQLPFLDNFEDEPVSWATGGGPSAIRSVVDGSYRISGTGIASSYPAASPIIADGTLTTQLKIVFGQTFAGIFTRSGEDGFSTYFAVIDNTGLFGLGESTVDGQIETKDQIQTDLNPSNSDVLIRLVTMGNTISADAWELGQPMPTEPMLKTVDDALAAGGFGVLINSGAPATVDYRFFEAVPEPTSVNLGLYSLPALILLRRVGPRRR